MAKVNWNLRMMAWILAVGTIGISAPARVLASSPEFSRTAEEWSALQDDNLEYSEIADLIHEYNPTVQNNQYEKMFPIPIWISRRISRRARAGTTAVPVASATSRSRYRQSP